MGRTTTWLTDVEGRRTAKQYSGGSQINYIYENTTSRLQEVIDEQQQQTLLSYNPDNTLKSIAYANDAVPTPSVTFSYDANYDRVVSMADGIGLTTYAYNPITSPPALGAGRLASVAGPLTNDTVAYEYDELGRPVQTTIDGVVSTRTFDAASRLTGESNGLGSFTYSYDGSSDRVVSQGAPNGQTAAIGYGNNLQDFAVQQITYAVGPAPVSRFNYVHDNPAARITNWLQQAGAQAPSLFTLGYDADNQLLSATVTNSGALVNSFAYSYDPAGNRLAEQLGGTDHITSYNALNQISAATAPAASRTNEWDGAQRLSAVNAGNQRTEFAYDGLNRLSSIRQLVSGSEASYRCFAWCDGQICEERDASGTNITKRFFFPRAWYLQRAPTRALTITHGIIWVPFAS